jgi:hypothetical protein
MAQIPSVYPHVAHGLFPLRNSKRLKGVWEGEDMSQGDTKVMARIKTQGF